MKKFGFTLAEILVTLGIIGVVTALALPTFTADTYNRANASKLASIVADYENIFGMMMLKEDKVGLKDTKFGKYLCNLDNPYTPTEVLQAWREYTKLGKEITNSSNIADLGYTSKMKTMQNADDDLTFDIAANTNTGATIFIDPKTNVRTEADAVTAGASCAIAVSDMFIDVNGSAPPNKYGRDVFAFTIGDDGVLYPFGSVTASFLHGSGTSSNPTWQDNDTEYGCSSGNYNGFGCTARLIENNYKMDY